MKKHYFLIYSLLCLGIVTTKAQIADVVSFDNASAPMGESPRGSLTLSGNILYGTTSAGGANGVGCIFSVNKNGTGYTDLHDFITASGEKPYGSLVLSASGTILYGMTSAGGLNADGCIFSINTNGSKYADVYDFDGAHGSLPSGSLVLSGFTLYGMTPSGGANGDGVIFSVDTNGTGYSDIHDFDGVHGQSPSGSVILSGTVLYGFTGDGGANAHGCIFSINTNGTTYTDMHDFDGTHGQLSQGDPILIGTVLYGLGTSGGANGDGCIFSINTNGTGFSDFYDFTTATGKFPYCTLALSGTVFYGVTQIGGANNLGVIFSINTNGTGYSDLYDFDGAHGQNPLTTGSLTVLGNVVYGTTFQGGANNDGVIFSFGNTSAGVNDMNVASEVNLYPNPNNGEFAIALQNIQVQCNIVVYNNLGQEVYHSLLNPNNTHVNLMDKATGVYYYRVVTENGELISNGKMVVE